MVNTNSVTASQSFHDSRHTFGILAPRSWYFQGFFKKLTNSRISCLASSQPATSWNRTLILSFTILALDSLMLKGYPRPRPPRPPTIGPCRMAKIKNPTSSKLGTMLKRSVLWGKGSISMRRWASLICWLPVLYIWNSHPSFSVLYKTFSFCVESRPSSRCAISRLCSNESTLPMLNHK